MRTAVMTAVRWHGRRDVRIETVPRAARPGPGEVRVRVAWCGLCGTDVHEYRSGPVKIPLDRHPVTGRCAPIVLGHEISGWIDALGPDVAETTGLAAGGLVALNALLPCGNCAECAHGAFHLCRSLGHLGMSADGGLAEFVTVPASMVVPTPIGMDAAVAGLAEPFAVAMHAVRQAGRPAGSDCLVIGAGTIGLAVALVLRADYNAVRLLDVAPERVRHANDLGLEARLISAAERSANLVAEPPAPVVFECSGAAEAPALAISLAAPGGLAVLAGLPESHTTVDFTTVVLREVRVVGTISQLAHADMAPALSFLSRHAGLAERLVTARIPLIAAVEQGLDVLAGPEGGRHAKVLVRVAGCGD
ncbi:MAG TPA: alcohol dehydrogenase catalytic domain-containing protein [Streptosporangiaceae bacterium]